MNTSIPFSGYTAVPSDYDAADGQLSLSLNLIHEDGALRPVSPPVEVLALQADESLLLIHDVPGQRNYILARESGDAGPVDILWLRRPDDVYDTASASLIGSYSDMRDITPIGNTIVIATATGLKYLLWKDDSYRQLGSRPPFISIDFGLYRAASLSDSGTFDIPANCGLHGRHGAATQAEWAYFTQIAYGLLLPSLADNVTSKGYFYQPFFIRYAYRLYDGSYGWQSAPILMLPTILPPFILYSEGASSGETTNVGLALSVPYFALAYRILHDGIYELADWRDIVAGIDIFISAPIYTYDQSKDIGSVTTVNSMLASISPDKVTTNSSSSGNDTGSPGRPGGTEITSSEVFIGHYADYVEGSYIDHAMSISGDITYLVGIKRHENFVSNIRDSHDFYKLAEIDFDSIKGMDAMAPLKIADLDLSALVTRPTLPDDYQSHCGLAASSLYAFNSRLNLAGVEITPAPPFPIRSVMQFGNPNAETAFAAHPRITVWSRLNGISCYALRDSQGASMADVWFDPANNFPRYIFYPDASAYLMEIFISSSQRYLLKLTPHDFLNGAYFFLGDAALGNSPLPSADDVSDRPPASAKPSVSVGSKIYTSEVNNPFVFPLSGINTVGSGQIMALSSAARALSQGQFGQFPLYAFASDGVWALETTATGSYSAKQPITRDVCVNPQSITQLDAAVLFATDRGVMLLSGSQATSISDAINTHTPFDSLRALPRFSDLMANHASGFSFDNCLPTLPFSRFLSGCRMIYDYPHQRIFLYNPSVTYAYLYSLKSKSWGMTHSDIVSGVPSYPNALAIHSDGSSRSVVDFSLSSTDYPGGLLLTRPLKLGAPDTLKTIDCIIQRGHFRRGSVRSVLYGSRDLFSWHLVWSSKDHFLRGFRGSPYKYFRLALLCDLATDESITSASIQFSPRLTNRPR